MFCQSVAPQMQRPVEHCPDASQRLNDSGSAQNSKVRLPTPCLLSRTEGSFAIWARDCEADEVGHFC